MPKPDTVKNPSLDDAGLVPIDVDRLIEGKLLCTAASGGGKSWAVRRVLEQTFGAAQHIVLDRDGEFHTLRERFEYVLFGDRGDFPVLLNEQDHKKTDPRLTYAGRVAIRLLELGNSAIIDLSGLGRHQDVWVKWFVESLMLAPRELWHAVEIVIDECHRFAPESGRGEARSTDAVIELATDGRKRGFCLIAATQRTAELHNTVIAMLHNKMIGLNTLQDDISRARRVIGMKPSEADKVLPELEPGQFFVRGPAFSRKVERIQVGAVLTTHPKAGARVLPPTPAPDRIQRVLGRLSDGLMTAEPEIITGTVPELQARIRELEGKLKSNKKIDDIAFEEMGKGYDAAVRKINQLEADNRQHERSMKAYRHMTKFVHGLVESIHKLDKECFDIENGKGEPSPSSATAPVPSTAEAVSQLAGAEATGLSSMARSILAVLRDRGALPKKKALMYALYARSGDTDKCFAEMTRNNYIATTGQTVSITPVGEAIIRTFDRDGTGTALRGERLIKEIRGRLNAMQLRLFDVLDERSRAEGGPIHKTQVLERARYKRSGDTDKAFAYLVGRDWAVMSGKGFIELNPELYA